MNPTPTLTITEVHRAKAELEQTIRLALEQFTQNTTVYVDRVDVTNVQMANGHSGKYIVEVKAKL